MMLNRGTMEQRKEHRLASIFGVDIICLTDRNKMK